MSQSVRFSAFMQDALYGRRGFYTTHGSAGGARGDFITSVETGPLFAAVMACALDDYWCQLGKPDPFYVAEAAAGVGTLWRGINVSQPECFRALHYEMVEVSDRMRHTHKPLLEACSRLSSSEVLSQQRKHVIFCNELLDNLVFDIAEFDGKDWREVLVGTTTRGTEEAIEAQRCFEWTLGAVSCEDTTLKRLVQAPVAKQRVPVEVGARSWLQKAIKKAEIVLAFDYGASTAELCKREGSWLRTYFDHKGGNDPLSAVGQLDITHDVAWDQLAAPKQASKQRDWLPKYGIEEIVEESRRWLRLNPHDRSLASYRHRSVLNEAPALCEINGLGDFDVYEWRAGDRKNR